ncbi:MAG: beta-galactosidase [Treponema sp.]|nr:beta-galactosidase [Treponema sp.]MCL2271778.1 beta-galactosidase [Treponema sp.]
MNFYGNVNKVLYGGDYNPEQWPKEIWKEDMRLFTLAGIDVLTINVFSWAALQPSEDEYNFSVLDEIIETISVAEMKICLATATATHPAWMARRYPEILRVNADGSKRKFGDRENSCPNSGIYRMYAGRLARKLAERYGKLENIIAWHISNEFSGYCYCDNCQNAFRQWLKKRYKTLETLNAAWNTSFWGHTYHDWEDIVSPSFLGGEWTGHQHRISGSCQIQSIDYRRFYSDSLLDCYLVEVRELREITPQIPVTTNLMGTYWDTDYFKWGKHMDFIAWDNYPWPDCPYTRISMNHALMRGCGNGKPFSLMEQTPSVTNWQPYNSLKRPGIMRLWSYQALAHGSDTVMFFQMRRSRGCCEKFHGAVIDHCGNENTRVFREVAALGEELKKLGDAFLDSRIVSQTAVLYDWDNWWATSISAGPTIDMNYPEEVYRYYDALAKQNYSVDIIGVDTALDNYKILYAPLLYMVKPGYAKKLKRFVNNGGILLTTYFSGMTDERDLVTQDGYPGELRELCGIWVEETDALLPDQKNGFVIKDGELAGTWKAEMLCDIIHPEGAEVIALYESDFYAGTPALCRNNFGKGQVWYFGARPQQELLDRVTALICGGQEIKPVFPVTEGIEAVCRIKDGKEFVFVLNHNKNDMKITISEASRDIITNKKFDADECFLLPAAGVLILVKN